MTSKRVSSLAAQNPKGTIHHPLHGMALMIFGVAILIILELGAKGASAEGIPVLQTVWMRFVVHLIIFTSIFGKSMGLDLVRTAYPAIQITRSILLFVMTVATFTALKHLQMVQVTTIGFAAPFIVAILSIFLLGERVGFHRWTAIVIGFVGVLVVIRPGTDGMHWAMGVFFIGVAGYALFLVLTRKIAGVENPIRSAMYTAIVGGVVLTFPMPWIWEWPATNIGWFYMILAGGAGAMAHFLIIKAHKFAEASLLGPLYYSQIVWSLLAGYLAFDDIPDGYTMAGAGIVISSGLYLMFRESLKRRRAK